MIIQDFTSLHTPYQCSISVNAVMQVNASDSRGKADAKIIKGIGGNTSNSIKELVSNEALSSNVDRFVFLCGNPPMTMKHDIVFFFFFLFLTTSSP